MSQSTQLTELSPFTAASSSADPRAGLPVQRGISAYFQRELIRLVKFHVRPRSRVLQVGCSLADLLAGVQAEEGVGVDPRGDVVARLARRRPDFRYHVASPERFELNETFDYVVIADTLGELDDIQRCLESVRNVCAPDARIILTYYNTLWEPILKLAGALRLRRRVPEQNWLTSADIHNLLVLADFQVIKQCDDMLCPLPIPLLKPLCNRVLSRCWPTRKLALIHAAVARPAPKPIDPRRLTCSVVIPTRNERGNIEEAVRRTPDMGAETEILFVDGHSDDGTPEEIERVIRAHPHRRIRFLRQEGRGKGDAMRQGFAQAKGDVLMILDADLTVPPEDLPKFFECLASGKGEFINGTRLVYPMERDAMRTLNKMANSFFSRLFSWLLDQRFRDTLCGTKVLWRRAYERLAADRAYFGDFDPFGDFDLIFGAAKANLKIIEIPIRYRARTYGVSHIHRFLHGLLLLRMSLAALWKLKLR